MNLQKTFEWCVYAEYENLLTDKDLEKLYTAQSRGGIHSIDRALCKRIFLRSIVDPRKVKVDMQADNKLKATFVDKEILDILCFIQCLKVQYSEENWRKVIEDSLYSELSSLCPSKTDFLDQSIVLTNIINPIYDGTKIVEYRDIVSSVSLERYNNLQRPDPETLYQHYQRFHFCNITANFAKFCNKIIELSTNELLRKAGLLVRKAHLENCYINQENAITREILQTIWDNKDVPLITLFPEFIEIAEPVTAV